MGVKYHKPKWNPVSTSIPTKANKFYLVTIDGETPYTDISPFDGTNWEDKGITHWMSMPSPGQKRWNDVNIIPPHESGTYLVVLDGELVGQKKPFTSICGFYDGKWDDWGVIRWMPLPEPAQQPQPQGSLSTQIKPTPHSRRSTMSSKFCGICMEVNWALRQRFKRQQHSIRCWNPIMAIAPIVYMLSTWAKQRAKSSKQTAKNASISACLMRNWKTAGSGMKNYQYNMQKRDTIMGIL